MKLWGEKGPFQQVEAKNHKDFLDIIMPTSSILGGYSHWIFRGQANANSWGLLPSSFRGYSSDEASDTEWRKHIIEEHIRVREFMVASDSIGLNVPSDSPDYREKGSPFNDNSIDRKISEASRDPSGWPIRDVTWQLALAQHHGVPTTMLDWTASPFVAAYFAAITTFENNSEEPLCVWVLNTDTIDILFPNGRDMPDPLGIYVIETSRATNGYLTAQKGLFTCLTRKRSTTININEESLEVRVLRIAERLQEQIDNDEDFGMQMNPYVEKSNPTFNKPFLLKVILSHEKAPLLLECLYRMFYHAGTLFPSYWGIVKMLEQRKAWLSLMDE